MQYNFIQFSIESRCHDTQMGHAISRIFAKTNSYIDYIIKTLQ